MTGRLPSLDAELWAEIRRLNVCVHVFECAYVSVCVSVYEHR